MIAAMWNTSSCATPGKCIAQISTTLEQCCDWSSCLLHNDNNQIGTVITDIATVQQLWISAVLPRPTSYLNRMLHDLGTVLLRYKANSLHAARRKPHAAQPSTEGSQHWKWAQWLLSGIPSSCALPWKMGIAQVKQHSSNARWSSSLLHNETTSRHVITDIATVQQLWISAVANQAQQATLTECCTNLGKRYCSDTKRLTACCATQAQELP